MHHSAPAARSWLGSPLRDSDFSWLAHFMEYHIRSQLGYLLFQIPMYILSYTNFQQTSEGYLFPNLWLLLKLVRASQDWHKLMCSAKPWEPYMVATLGSSHQNWTTLIISTINNITQAICNASGLFLDIFVGFLGFLGLCRCPPSSTCLLFGWWRLSMPYKLHSDHNPFQAAT